MPMAADATSPPTASSLNAAWHELVSKHVDVRGAVSYRGFAQTQAQLNAFLTAHRHMQVGKLTENAKKALYINLYNAFMIACILRYAQEKSIDLNGQKFLQLQINSLRVSGGNIWNGTYRINLAGQLVNLDDIEHKLLRGKKPAKLAALQVKQLDPRIHMAVNCAARSCPRLRHQAYTEKNIEQMLDENMRTFVNGGKQLYWDTARRKIVLNKIILWYYEDFDNHGRTVLGKGGAGDYLRSYLSGKSARATRDKSSMPTSTSAVNSCCVSPASLIFSMTGVSTTHAITNSHYGDRYLICHVSPASRT